MPTDPMADEEASRGAAAGQKRSRERMSHPEEVPEGVSEPELQKRRLSLTLKKESSQIYAIPTYDATFKYIMADPEICLSVLQAFIPDENLISAKLQDTHLRPFKQYTKVRSIINDIRSKKIMQKVNDLIKHEEAMEDDFQITYKKDEEHTFIPNGGWMIKSFAEYYGDFLSGYPKPRRNSQVDYICQTNDGHYAFVEVQVIPEDFWDQRALAYAASIYGRQLKEGDEWGDINKVISVNILGGGLRNEKWNMKSSFRKYTFKDQDGHDIENGIEVLQYPLYHQSTRDEGLKLLKAEELKQSFMEWMDFFESAQKKKRETSRL